jgi:predicted Rossmann fold flavoprotein
MTASADVIVIGAGAAGLMAAFTAGQRGKRVVVLEHTNKPGEKIRISGGGRCNFTNVRTKPANYLSQNPHFCKSALGRYTPHDFIALVNKYGIAWHEKDLGQLFCDGSANQIVELLLAECAAANVILRIGNSVSSVTKTDDLFTVVTNTGTLTAPALVIACGGLSIPKIGATGFGYELARQFGHEIVLTRAALVPLAFTGRTLEETADLTGVSLDPIEVASEDGARFREALLFTHRGLSGPAILQISSYWREGQTITVNLLPERDVLKDLKAARQSEGRKQLRTILGQWLPERLAERIATRSGFDTRIADLNDTKLGNVAGWINRWEVLPAGSEGYRTAEVTLGGIDTTGFSSKTLMSNKVPGLYAVGEVMDVTGHLGGYNFQWAWASGRAAGQAI